MSVLALALKRIALSHGTVPKDCPNGTRPPDATAGRLPDVQSHGTVPGAVPTGHEREGGTNGTLGTVGTIGTSETNDAIEERAGLAADRVPTVYLDAWARQNCQKPASVAETEWQLALDDGGRFLDAWGRDAATLGWTPDALFDVGQALVWRLAGARVVALGPDHAQLSDGRTIYRRGRDYDGDRN